MTNTTAAVSTPPPARVARVTLANVKRGKQKDPPRLFIYGVEGIGKSTIGASAPKPIFLGAEDGAGQLDVARFPQPTNLIDVADAISSLTNDTHEFETLVIDTVDWLEPIIWDYICKRDDVPNIEGYGFGKGFQIAIDEWRKIINALEKLRAAKRMGVVLLGHSMIKNFKNPEGEDFDRYELKINLKAGGLLKEWVDAVLFANHETFAKKATRDEKNKTAKAKGISTGARLLFTERTAAYDAKNRYNLPPQLPLSWTELELVMAVGSADAPSLVAEIKRKAAQLAAPELEKVTAAIGRAGTDVKNLVILNNYVNARTADAANANPASTAKES